MGPTGETEDKFHVAQKIIEADGEKEEEDEYRPKAADETKANSLLFAKLCERLESLWKYRNLKSNKTATKNNLLQLLLPPQLKHYLGPTGSPFPLLRLIMPEIDTSRPNVGMKEKIIANCWSDAMGFSRGSNAYEKLVNFTIPEKAGPTAVGDFSLAIYEVMKDRYSTDFSSVTIGQINDMLDKLVAVKRGIPINNSERNIANRSYASKQVQRQKWVEELIGLNLSPLEHKWIVRIMLQKLEIGMKHNSILKYYHPMAEELYGANKSLRSLCTILSDPECIKIRQARIDLCKQMERDHYRLSHMPKSVEKVKLGNTITPMLSKRTGFITAIHDMESRHKDFVNGAPDSCNGLQSLALKFPAFMCEEKLDGERMVVHVKRGIVTMHTRNGTWYSRAYSPTIGPAIRQSLSNFDIDVILDGEMISWDDGNKETIAFGYNRTVAKERKEWMQQNGTLDERDINPHPNVEDDRNILKVSNTPKLCRNIDNAENDSGSDCWLKYVTFDILYIDGPDALKLIKSSNCIHEDSLIQAQCENLGSIMNLPTYQRKSILYNLINPQENQVEIVESIVVRPDGSFLIASEYFLSRFHEFGHPCTALDSINLALDGWISNLEEIDEKRKSGHTDKYVAQQRALAVDRFYSEIVERKCKEGLVFKDLASPYFPGEKSRGYGYWRKLKQDYEEDGHASDIDVVVLGGYFATGMSNAGLINKFLVGCADRQPDGTVLYMPMCKIYSGHVDRKTIDRALEYTGFQAGEYYGNWFQSDVKDRKMPDFISQKSFQTHPNGEPRIGWKAMKRDFPDLWIRPEDSFVLTLNAGEIVASDAFSAGISLRFPRITRLRLDEGYKSANEINNIDDLHNLYESRQLQMSQESQIGTFSRPIDEKNGSCCRFLTPAQGSKKKRPSRSKKPISSIISAADLNVFPISSVLEGISFAVYEGKYELDANSSDARTAKEEGWFDDAIDVKSRNDVILFIRRHGGKCELGVNFDTDYIVGGSHDDARVSNYKAAVNNVLTASIFKTSKSGKVLKKMVEIGGILKWVFIFATVHQLMESEERSKEGNIKKTEASFFPKPQDYLILSKSISSQESKYENDLFQETSRSDFKHMLNELREDKRKTKRRNIESKLSKMPQTLSGFSASDQKGLGLKPQHFLYSSLCDEKNWIIKREQQVLLPYRMIHDDKIRSVETDDVNFSQTGLIVLYPHIFNGTFGFKEEDRALSDEMSNIGSNRWNRASKLDSLNSISACLPLAKFMGAKITTHLHNKVTHVLCEMTNHEIFAWKRNMSNAIFCNKETGTLLHERLLSLDDDFKDQTRKITLVTPSWIKKKWDE